MKARSLKPFVALAAAGYDAAESVEIVLHVALNTLTNYVNEVAKTEIDFPRVTHGKGQAPNPG